jgi:trigger factor
MIRFQIETDVRNHARQYQMAPEDFLKLLSNSGQSIDEFTAQMRPGVIKTLQGQLIMDAIMNELGLSASEEDQEKELERLAAETGSSIEDVKKYYEQDQAQGYLAEEIKRTKLFDILLAENTIKKGKQEKYLDIVK